MSEKKAKQKRKLKEVNEILALQFKKLIVTNPEKARQLFELYLQQK